MKKVYKNEDCNIKSILDKKVGVIGYGIQGRAQALNLRDSGCDVVIGNIDDEYKTNAQKDGFNVFDIDEMVKMCDIILLLIPDESQKFIYETYVESNISEDNLLVFAHGYALRYGKITLSEKIDVGLLAPRFPGKPIRDHYKKGKGVPAFVDVINDHSDRTLEKLLALGYAIGYSRAGLIPVSYKEETELDLFIEHFIGPLFIGAIENSLNFLIERGYDSIPSILELYLSGERGSMWTTYAKDGLYKGLINNASPTCKFGIASHMNETFNKELHKQMEKVINNIQSGKFSERLEVEEEKDYKNVNNFFEDKKTSLITNVEKEVKDLLEEYL